ncbi:MAG: protein translocase subunit SecF [Acidimicrobiia bacterium]|nr:protein translocase subunit SecF [Acidimicrobiia bacterium]MDX2466915.1 protein translocase subunit SecF [Acidimicrobiia bacterium]
MSLWRNLYRGETEFDFVQHRRRFFVISAVLIGVSLLSLLVRGLDGSVDFTGGTIVEAPIVAVAEVADFRDGLSAIGQDGARVQIRTERDETETVVVQTEALTVADRDELLAAVATVAGIDPNDASIDAVGPTFGSEITRRAIEALVIFLIVVALFITWRFEWKMAAGALVALFHDLIITAGVYSIIGFEVTPSTVIAILTILGYSLYDTVVVFDKITENVHELGSRHTFTEIANLSMNQVLMRSLNTSLTSLLPIGSLLLVGSYLLGAATLREFALALFIGIAAGTYSSIFVATPLLTEWKEREPEWQRMQRRVARRSGETVLTAAEAATATATEERATGAAPRAPKQRRRR